MLIKRLSLYLAAAVTTSCLLVAVATSASQPNSSLALNADSPYPVLDSGVWADAQHDPYLFWIDNDRVLFKNAEFPNKRKAYQGRFNLAVWDTQTNKVTPHTDYAQGVRACYADGYLSYVLYDDRVVKNYAEQLAKKRIRYFAGSFGKEQPLAVPAQQIPVLNEFSCRFITDLNHPVYRKDRLIKPLKEGHGYLDYGLWSDTREIKQKKPFLYYQMGKDKAHELSITQDNVLLQISYYPFKNAYYLHRFVNGPWSPQFEKSWWLYPNGKIEEVPIPQGIWKGPSVGFFQTKIGTFVIYGTFKRAKEKTGFRYEIGDSGGYLVNGAGEIVKVIPGYIKSLAISPDGCKAAIVHYEHPDATLAADPRPIARKSINFCRE